MSSSNDFSHIQFKCDGDITSVPDNFQQYFPDYKSNVCYTCDTRKFQARISSSDPNDEAIMNLDDLSAKLERCAPKGSVHNSYEDLYTKIRTCSRNLSSFSKSSSGTIKCNTKGCPAKICCSSIIKKKVKE